MIDSNLDFAKCLDMALAKGGTVTKGNDYCVCRERGGMIGAGSKTIAGLRKLMEEILK